jgi:hypothetical protein
LILLLMFAGFGCNPTVPTGPKNRKIHPATQPGQVLEISIPELGNFDFDPEAKDPKIPDDVKALSGVTVKLHGYMVPIDQASHITRFALVPGLQGGEGPPPLLQQIVVINCPAEKPVEYDPNEIIVQGKLTVDLIKDDGFIVAIFEVHNAVVKPN